MDKLQDFFLFCSGAERQIIKRTPTEINRLVGIGACVFFTGVFAFAAASYALYTVFNSVVAASFFGLLWGLMIFNLDRYIVSTLRKKGRFFRDFTSVIPRLLLALLIAVVIAKPLELKIFESEINAEIALMEQENRIAQESLLDERFEPDIQKLNSEISSLKSELAEKADQRDRLANNALMEADGTGGSQKRNMGPIYAIKKAEADKAQDEYVALASKNGMLIDQKQERIDKFQGLLDSEMNELVMVSQTGLASRIQALSRVSAKNNAVFLAGVFIMLLFIAIETAPIVVKLMNERSPYDYVLDKHEFAYAMNHRRINSILENETVNQIDYELQTSQHRTKLLIDAENKIMSEALKTELERVDPRSVKWKGILKRSGLFSAEG